MAINVENVTMAFGKLTALDNILLTFEKGHIYGLLGNNGAGKTTLLNIISNRLFATKGRVTIDNEHNEHNDHALGKIFYDQRSKSLPGRYEGKTSD